MIFAVFKLYRHFVPELKFILELRLNGLMYWFPSLAMRRRDEYRILLRDIEIKRWSWKIRESRLIPHDLFEELCFTWTDLWSSG